MTTKTAIYPGTFDPITNGHVDLITRASRLFDTLFVAVAENTSKTPAFTLTDRLNMIHESLSGIANVKIISFTGLLVDCAKTHHASTVIRGLRAVSDFDYEFQLYGMNKKLDASLETIFLPANETTSYISSSLIREILSVGGDVSSFVPPIILDRIQQLTQEQ